MFDFVEIEEDVGRKGNDFWKESEHAVPDKARASGHRTTPSRLPAAEVDGEVEEHWVLRRDGRTLELHVGVARASSTYPAKPKHCVLFVPGMPHTEYGNARMSDPMPTAILQRCWAIGLPTVRFDYLGCGKSKGQLPALGEDRALLQECAALMLQRVLRDLCERAVVIAHSAGIFHILHEMVFAHSRGLLAAYVSINPGTRAAALIHAEGMKELQKASSDLLDKDTLDAFDMLDVPSLFVLGDKDWLTPKVDIEAIIRRTTRKDFGNSLLELQVLPGKHVFEGVEAAPAEAIKTFLLERLS